jgi:ppGpp synthetase/RelA/SpoT-type nucleotidyltranferase
LYGAEIWTLREVDEKYMKYMKMWCCRMEEFRWSDRVRNENVLRRVKEARNILQKIGRKKSDWSHLS